MVGVEQGTCGATRARGLLAPTGVATIELAKENGSWARSTRWSDSRPPDLGAALDADAAARENWNNFSPSSRKGILW
jgi:uncharacterized protein YdeI (YjbR/CyaY-like superfamily)